MNEPATFEAIHEATGGRTFDAHEIDILERLARSYPIRLTIVELAVKDRSTVRKRLAALEKDGYAEKLDRKYVIAPRGIALLRLLGRAPKNLQGIGAQSPANHH